MNLRFLTSFVGTFLLTLAVLATSSYAIVHFTVHQPHVPYRTAVFEFDLAPAWSCEQEGAMHVCYPTGKKPYAATVIIALKERGSTDSLKVYEDYLKQPKKSELKNKEIISKVRYVKRRLLGGREWVEGLHSNSEVLNYDTYYLATVTSAIGILVTLSVHKDHVAEYIQQLNEMMGTLYVYQKV